jgi:hypothetical protein
MLGRRQKEKVCILKWMAVSRFRIKSLLNFKKIRIYPCISDLHINNWEASEYSQLFELHR